MEQLPLFSKHRLTPAQKALLRRCRESTDGVVLYDLAGALRRTAVCLCREGYVTLLVWLTADTDEPRLLDFASFPARRGQASQRGRWGLRPQDALLVDVAWKVEVRIV